MSNALLDTGAFVALLDRSEQNHNRCVNFFKEFKGKLFTTEPVLTETIYLLGPNIQAQKICIEFILKGGAILVSQTRERLSSALKLMEKYSDLPMDFADATLVSYASEMDINDVFTLDIKDFNTYRINNKKSFQIWPE